LNETDGAHTVPDGFRCYDCREFYLRRSPIKTERTTFLSWTIVTSFLNRASLEGSPIHTSATWQCDRIRTSRCYEWGHTEECHLLGRDHGSWWTKGL